MSNPSGPGPDDAETAGALGHSLEDDSEPVTEVIDIPTASAAAVTDTAERRYTAPGFDAGSTQIIGRLPDEAAPTEVFTAATRPRVATPQAIPARKPERPSWLLPILLAVVALAAAAALVAFVLIHRANSAEAARVQSVRATISTFDTAVHDGNLATLRSVTCGAANDAYVNYDERDWADAHARISEAKQYPVVASIDDVVVNGTHAEANVTSYMAFDPATTSTRSFDLQFRDNEWKICQAT